MPYEISRYVENFKRYGMQLVVLGLGGVIKFERYRGRFSFDVIIGVPNATQSVN